MEYQKKKCFLCQVLLPLGTYSYGTNIFEFICYHTNKGNKVEKCVSPKLIFGIISLISITGYATFNYIRKLASEINDRAHFLMVFIYGYLAFFEVFSLSLALIKNKSRYLAELSFHKLFKIYGDNFNMEKILNAMKENIKIITFLQTALPTLILISYTIHWMILTNQYNQ